MCVCPYWVCVHVRRIFTHIYMLAHFSFHLPVVPRTVDTGSCVLLLCLSRIEFCVASAWWPPVLRHFSCSGFKHKPHSVGFLSDTQLHLSCSFLQTFGYSCLMTLFQQPPCWQVCHSIENETPRPPWSWLIPLVWCWSTAEIKIFNIDTKLLSVCYYFRWSTDSLCLVGTQSSMTKRVEIDYYALSTPYQGKLT